MCECTHSSGSPRTLLTHPCGLGACLMRHRYKGCAMAARPPPAHNPPRLGEGPQRSKEPWRCPHPAPPTRIILRLLEAGVEDILSESLVAEFKTSSQTSQSTCVHTHMHTCAHTCTHTHTYTERPERSLPCGLAEKLGWEYLLGQQEG